MFTATVVLLILSVFSKLDALYDNKFEATRGCRQFNADQGYEFPHHYFPTSAFKNVRTKVDNTKELRIGVFGNNDAHIRLAPVQYPYDGTYMNEIVLSGDDNTRSFVRRYARTSPSETTNRTVLLNQSSLGLMSVFKPLMFNMTIHPNGSVKLTRDGERVPFLEFVDSTLSSRFVGFCNWNSSVIFFFDCPFK